MIYSLLGSVSSFKNYRGGGSASLARPLTLLRLGLLEPYRLGEGTLCPPLFLLYLWSNYNELDMMVLWDKISQNP